MNEQQKIEFDDYCEHLEDPYFVLHDMERWINNMLMVASENKTKRPTRLNRFWNKLK